MFSPRVFRNLSSSIEILTSTSNKNFQRFKPTVTSRMNLSYSNTVVNSADCIDLRSDTVSLPSEKMREVMASAILGDDVYREDFTINALEERCANLFGKEAAIFVCSGTMGNLLAVMAHCQRGDEIIVGRQSHIHRWEQGNYAQLAGISATTIDVLPDGTLALSDIESSIRVQDFHMPTTKLICIENTHNFAGGKILPIDYLQSVRTLADRHGLSVHMDGARVYNAAVASGQSVKKIASYVDSLMMCFSKGLGAPVGSILLGSKILIDRARRSRKAIGGGWRQAGVLASAAHVALDQAELTVAEDHKNAKLLARGINDRTPNALKNALYANEDGLTNIIVITCGNGIAPSQLTEFFKKHNVLCMCFDDTRVRMVLNWGVKEENVKQVLKVYELFVASLQE